MSDAANYLVVGFLACHPLSTSASLSEAGVDRHALARAIEHGDAVRLGHGIICSPSAQSHPCLDYAAACLATGGVLCLGAAGMYHGLTDEAAPEIETYVPFNSRGDRMSTMPVRRVRARNPDALTLGVETVDVLGTAMRITNRPRTVVDLHRMGSRQHAVAALNTYLGEGGDGDELRRMAEPFGAWGRMAPLVEVVLDGLSRPAGP